MDPAEFGISSLPLQHTPYTTISSETLAKSNEGKVAVVTGAAGGTFPIFLTFVPFSFPHNSLIPSGIGAAIAVSLAKSGANLALLDLPSSNQETTKTACEKEGMKVVTYGCNVANFEKTKEVFGNIEKALGAIE